MTAAPRPEHRPRPDNPFASRWWVVPVCLLATLLVGALHGLVFVLVFGEAGKNATALPLALELPPIELDLEPLDTVPSLPALPDDVVQPPTEASPPPSPPPPPPVPEQPDEAPPDEKPDDTPPPEETPPLPEDTVTPETRAVEPEKTEKPEKTEPRPRRRTAERPAKPQQAPAPPPGRDQPRSSARLPSPSALPGRTRSNRDSWQSRVLLHLDQRKKYPPAAAARREQGEAIVRFVVDRQGQVLSVQLVRSSGFMLLDKEVHDLFRRAQPLPLPPGDLPEDRFEIELPIRFRLY